jgi:glycosyltransferase involved in cell wall biosynthesis
MLITTLIVRNEAARPWLRTCLTKASEYSDKIVILDDKSDDNRATEELCRSFSKVIFRESPFNEARYSIHQSDFRITQWDYTREVAKEGDWILALDSDNVFEDNFKSELEGLMKSSYDWFQFRLLDLWDDKHYRSDGWWSPLIECMFRFKDEPANWPRAIMHVPLLPGYILSSSNGCVRRDIRLLHYGWIEEEKRASKVEFYKTRCDGDNLKHALSVLEPAQLAEV